MFYPGCCCKSRIIVNSDATTTIAEPLQVKSRRKKKLKELRAMIAERDKQISCQLSEMENNDRKPIIVIIEKTLNQRQHYIDKYVPT